MHTKRFAPRKKLLALFIFSTLILNACSNINKSSREAEARGYKTVPLSEFFPTISGDISEYSIQQPDGYESYSPPNQALSEAIVWGKPQDLELLNGPEKYDATLRSYPIFSAHWNIDVFAKGDHLESEGNPITTATLEKKGIEVIDFTSGLFHGIAGVPALAMNGVAGDETLYWAYIWSPGDDVVLQVSLRSSKNVETDKQVWATFVKSLEIR
jgi:hypothetical protein